MGIARSGVDLDKAIADAVWRARRAVGQLPLMLLIPVTALLTLLTAPIGLILPPLVWLARHSWRYERELAELYGRDSAELEDLHR